MDITIIKQQLLFINQNARVTTVYYILTWMSYFNSLIDFRLDKYDLIFQMRKLSLKKMKRPKQITVYKCPSQYVNSDLLPPKHILFVMLILLIKRQKVLLSTNKMLLYYRGNSNWKIVGQYLFNTYSMVPKFHFIFFIINFTLGLSSFLNFTKNQFLVLLILLSFSFDFYYINSAFVFITFLFFGFDLLCFYKHFKFNACKIFSVFLPS